MFCLVRKKIINNKYDNEIAISAHFQPVIDNKEETKMDKYTIAQMIELPLQSKEAAANAILSEAMKLLKQ